jgi:cytochrome bd-type quinol oxidase subunit 2
MQVIITLIVWAAMGFVCMEIAKKKGRNPSFWFVIGMLFSIFAVLAVAFLPHA